MRNQRLIQLRSFRKAKLYPDKLIKDGISKSQIIPIASVRSPKGKESNPTVPLVFVYTHNPDTHLRLRVLSGVIMSMSAVSCL